MSDLFGSEPAKMLKGADLSPCGIYRYSLYRRWGSDGYLPPVLFVMLNPSTADADIDDPTIRRCVGFAKSWGYLGIEVVNLFGLRATHPAELYAHTDPVGPGNDDAVRAAAWRAGLIVAGWGAHGSRHRGRVARVLSILGAPMRPVHAIGHTGAMGEPKHPLYLRADAWPILYKLPGG
jgi:hypothetical protein